MRKAVIVTDFDRFDTHTYIYRFCPQGDPQSLAGIRLKDMFGASIDLSICFNVFLMIDIFQSSWLGYPYASLLLHASENRLAEDILSIFFMSAVPRRRKSGKQCFRNSASAGMISLDKFDNFNWSTKAHIQEEHHLQGCQLLGPPKPCATFCASASLDVPGLPRRDS
jgi:hypothetical protein